MIFFPATGLCRLVIALPGRVTVSRRTSEERQTPEFSFHAAASQDLTEAKSLESIKVTARLREYLHQSIQQVKLSGIGQEANVTASGQGKAWSKSPSENTILWDPQALKSKCITRQKESLQIFYSKYNRYQ
jgi:hypothetical protein